MSEFQSLVVIFSCSHVVLSVRVVLRDCHSMLHTA